MGKISTHVLNLVTGRPADGMKVALYRRGGGGGSLVVSVWTNADGRTDEPLLAGAELATCEYEIVFSVGEYFAQGEGAFLTEVPVRFTVADESASYHVPLLCTPWAYQTYRGS